MNVTMRARPPCRNEYVSRRVAAGSSFRLALLESFEGLGSWLGIDEA